MISSRPEYLDVPDWLAVGCKVLETGRPGFQSVRTVVKHTATQVVLDNAARYRRKYQGENQWNRNGTGPWEYGYSVHPINGTKASQLRKEETARRSVEAVSARTERWRQDPTPARAYAASEALLSWAELNS